MIERENSTVHQDCEVEHTLNKPEAFVLKGLELPPPQPRTVSFGGYPLSARGPA